MSLETIFGLMNFDKIAEVFFALTSAFFSFETFIILYFLAIVGGILFSFEYFLVKSYRAHIQATSGVMLDLELKAPTEVKITGERVVVTPDTVESYLPDKQDLEDAKPFVDEVDKFVKFITLLQLIVTLPFSIIYAPLMYWVVNRKVKVNTPKERINTMLQLYYASNKVTAVLKWLWTTVFTILIVIVIVAAVILLVVGVFIISFGGVL